MVNQINKPLKLGVLGMSEGNGHPYSWSAIFNGYEPSVMRECPFPVIPAYLEKQKFPEDQIKAASVTHVWTQDPAVSRHVASASRIPHVVADYRDLVGQVDAVLLARDDAERHLEFAAPFLDAGLPIYIDKPVATRVADMERLFELQRYPGQIFSCSALRYARELQLDEAERSALGDVRFIDACVIKSWEKYAVHIIDPVLRLLSDDDEVDEVVSLPAGDRRVLSVRWRSGVVTVFTTLGQLSMPIVIRVAGEHGYRALEFKDTYNAFKGALQAFVDQVRSRHVTISPEHLRRVVTLIEAGMQP